MNRRLLAAVLIASAAVVGGCSKNSATPTTAGSFCTLLGAFQASNADLDVTLAGDDTANVKVGLQRLGRQLVTLQAQAPAELKADISEMSAFVASLDTLLATYGYDITALQSDPGGVRAFSELSLDQYTASRDLVAAYDTQTCQGAPASSGT